MKYKIKVEIHNLGEHTDHIIRVIAAHNSGIRTITPLDLEAYLRVRDAIYTVSSNDLAYINSDSDFCLNISRDKGQTYSLTLTWIPVNEVKDDIPNDLFTNGVSDLEKEILK